MSAESLEDLNDWVLTESVPEVVKRMTAMRCGDPARGLKPRPAAALRILHKFARRREVADLLGSTDHFEHLDAMSILATAALTRPVREAAELALRQWERESGDGSGQTHLTHGIVYDVASQRTALDVAEFIKACRRKPEAKLAEQTLHVFGGSGSTRTNLDKARLYIMLRDDCEPEAAELLRLTLREVGKRAQAQPANGPDELHDLVGALHHLSPNEPILVAWIKVAMGHSRDLAATVRLVANLLTAAPRGAESLAQYVGEDWNYRNLVQVCGLLHEGAPEAYDAVLGYLAARRDPEFLADLVIAWHKSPSLAKSTNDLIAAIVAQGESGDDVPRLKSETDDILAQLEAYGAPAECLRMLRTEAAAHLEGRTGDEVAELLHSIDSRRERQLAARIIGERLAEKVLRERTEADEELFVNYLKALREREDTDSAYWALRELPDPAEADQAGEGAAAVIGAIAKRLYAERLDEAGFNLLERCLENEQWVTPQDVGEVVASLRDSEMTAESRLDLLSATVGRWSELRRRGQAVTELRDRGFEDEAAAVIQSLR